MPEAAPSNPPAEQKPKPKNLAKAASFIKKYLLPNFHQKSIPGRRAFLGAGLAVAGLAATGGLLEWGYKAFIEPPEDFYKSSATERIQNAGLGDFVPFYETVTELQNFYYGKPVLSGSSEWTVAGDGTDPYYILFKVGVSEGYYSNDDTDYQYQVSKLRDGWGERKHDAVELALQKAGQMKITDNNGTPLNEAQTTEVRTAYNRFTKTVPAMVMMAPYTLVIFDGGGGYISPSTPGDRNSGNIELGFPLTNPEGFYVAGIHEHAHAEVEWEQAKAVVNRKDYADYIALEAKNIKLLLDDYFTTPWKDALTYIQDEFNTGPLVWYYGGDAQLTSVPYHDDNPNNPSLESNFKTKYNIDLDKIAPLEPWQKGVPSLIFNRVIWAAGHFQQQILQKQAEIQRTKKGTLTKEEKAYLQDPDIAVLLKRAVGEVDHYFRGPVQQYGGGFPGLHFPPLQLNSLLTKLNIEVQQARLKAFSTLTQEQLSNPTHAFQALRNDFGLDNPPLAA